MTRPRPSFWSTLHWELRLRVLALALCLLLGLAHVLLRDTAPDLAPFAGWPALALGVYVLVMEALGLTFAYSAGWEHLSLIASLLAWGLEHFVIARWLLGGVALALLLLWVFRSQG